MTMSSGTRRNGSFNHRASDDFATIPEFAPYHDRIQVLRDGVRLSLGAM